MKQRSRNFIQLHQQVTKVYAGYSAFFCELQVKSALAFFAHFPAPRHLKGYAKEQLTKEMKEYTKIFRESKAELISEIGNIKRFKSHKQLARYAGVAPVTVGSTGKNVNESS